MSLSAKPITNSTLAAIHTLRRRAFEDEDSFRDFLQKETGVRSSKQLNMANAPRVIERLRELSGDRRPDGAVAGLDGAIGKKLRALWIAGYDLAIVRDRTDRAMLAFLERQTDVSHVRFLADSRAGTAAIEGLKSWLARDGKVEWPAGGDATAAKRAVINAIWLRLVDSGGVTPFTSHQPLFSLDPYAYRVARRQGWEHFEPHHYDEVQNALGRKLRGWLAQKERQAC